MLQVSRRGNKDGIAADPNIDTKMKTISVEGQKKNLQTDYILKVGGPVGDADEILRRWKIRRHELRSSMNTIILPLGKIDVGHSRHRALLFKVLADKINLPCMLVKGSYYTGTDDGAVNLIKIDSGIGSEYIIDLMGASGTLIPTKMWFMMCLSIWKRFKMQPVAMNLEGSP
ncbi:probable serine/threonine-protein kinase SIS8 isoform X2 [Rosa rugosa]|uniref:probable serine/threonine-protein kinase SIS8 isoform X2 n=1 Tax=Rosa rugosa TaxID=74645 RepID=UPI002B4067E3|nr:probable serine/threonine-protein kinase SIS8 isoform X2 [Rosa rugosa]XP_062023118.1 probable serine/threonine-protein kinase SIS8 isoform X2 [Rosa rugosa]XP_062023119.1 probable serine/threonine-protein kinase SIS8 isoform X2 [Rosa rugosa]XP_062023120.1 probable serine/threonine-protein kinase SIS8 isoform X2 [Rosa rugosa]XP_062023121.1 probable serine/threonine-protein kinase SIS8 isoform X2 [Rosa rugosa]XP_062023122.1 probable serine/threonine-protein kinase SIS8 isoform X2 [Rosa rugosa]